MKQRINIVIDLETASLQSDAAICSIAAQVFDPMALVNKPNALPFPPEGKSPSPQFSAVVNVASCITAGLHFEMETVKWWSERSDEAKASILATPVLLATALEELSKWLDLLRSHLDCASGARARTLTSLSSRMLTACVACPCRGGIRMCAMRVPSSSRSWRCCLAPRRSLTTASPRWTRSG